MFAPVDVFFCLFLFFKCTTFLLCTISVGSVSHFPQTGLISDIVLSLLITRAYILPFLSDLADVDRVDG